MRTLLSLVCLWLGMNSPLAAQRLDPGFSVFGPEQGLIGTGVTAFARDTLGQLWVGTQEGLYRYDGVAFHGYEAAPGVPGRLGDDFVRALVHTPDGTLWIGTSRGGLQRYDPRTDRFETVALPGTMVMSLAAASDGTLWVGTDTALFRRTPGGDFQPLPAETGYVEAVAVTAGGPWAATAKGVMTFDPATGAAVSRRLPKRVPPPSVFVVDAQGTLWAGGAGGLLRLTPGTAEQVFDEPVRALADAGGLLWVGLDNDLVAFDPAQQRVVQRFVPSTTQARSLQQGGVTGLWADDATLWVGFALGGVAARPLRLPVLRFLHADGQADGLPGDGVRSLALGADGTLWFGTLDGFLCRARDTARPRCSTRWRLPAPLTVADALAVDAEGTVWVAGRLAGLWQFHPASGRWGAAPGLPQGHTARALLRDRQGTLWVSSYLEGVYRYTPTSRYVRHYAAHRDSMPHTYAWPLLEAADGAVWIGTMGGGVTRLHVAQSAFTTWAPAAPPPRTLADARVLSLAQTPDGAVWVGHMHHGLSRIAPDRQSVEHLGLASGLRTRTVPTLAVDLRGALWIPYSGGIMRLDAATRHLQTMAWPPGLGTSEPFVGASAVDAGGRLHVGMVQGLLTFHPDSLFGPPTSLKARVAELRLFNQPLHTDTTAPFLRHLVLPYHQNFVSIGFAASARAEATARFQYRLDGLDADWVEANGRHLADYAGLRPGRYVFHVRAAPFGTSTFGPTHTLALSITPPYWETLWFRLLVAAALAALAYAGYYYRLQALLRVERTRRRIADDLHDDLGAKLSTLAIQLELAGRVQPAANRSTFTRFSDTARSLVGDLRDAVWVIDGERDTLESLADRLETTGYALLGAARFRFERPASLPEAPLPMETRRHLLLLAKEALHNAHRHAAPAPVTLCMAYERGELAFVIRDEGPGFDPATVLEGQGLRTLERRAAALGARLSLHSAPHQGTTVAVTLPLDSRG